MLFNSFEFLIFLPLVFVGYWFVFKTNLRFQNGFVLVASYLFYGWWDYRFLGLIILSTVLDLFISKALGKEGDQRTGYRKLLVSLSVVFNLGMLFIFKYYNFFIESWVELVGRFGYAVNDFDTINIILPVGISFYTFQTLSYTIDVYRKQLSPSEDLVEFATYVAFFPQLVAGPIERATNLLPQIQKNRTFSYTQASQGMRLILWGLFKKVVIADSLAEDVNFIFSNYASLDGSTLLLGAIYFSIQIYGDFSGYSDIAIGVSKLFGFEIRSNFKFPYFSRSIAEFWQRWHISLSSWFRDYLYIPLGGSRNGKLKAIRNVFIVFVISGLWHGANLTFLAWGGIHAALYLPLFIIGRTKQYNIGTKQAEQAFHLLDILKMLGCFLIVTLAWVFFRSPDINTALHYLFIIATDNNLKPEYTNGLGVVVTLLALDWSVRKNERDIQFSSKQWVRTVIYLIMAALIYQGLFSNEAEFIYFQF